uniref:HTH-type transcriptional regulator MalT n=1 Tax=Thermosporothrix sp. COM3 TaxID=2490863 RepID=A0A455SA67_9CHLR|nr:HTH-type transcriptional regulator MalT [Thermosporothrix sp. COM3]
MPKSAQYIISWQPEQAQYYLAGPEGTATCPLSLEGEAWQAWLGEHRAFAFHGRAGQINLLKEKRARGIEGYWYAYHRHGERMVKRYAGRSAQLNLERLEDLAALLAHNEKNKAQQEKKKRHALSISAGESAASLQEQTAFVSFADQTAAPPTSQFEPLFIPKLQLPPLQRSLLPRQRLQNLLDKSLEYRVTLVTGPAGFGKTTLINQWIATRSMRAGFPSVACITLDEGDNDPIRFWRYVIAACQRSRPGFGKEALELLLAQRLPPFKPLDRVPTVLLNELSQLERPVILVLDDFHVINAPAVIESFSFFIEHLPASVHVIILIRGDAPFPMARLRARNELLEIDPPHLGFSLEETGAFFEQELACTLSPGILRQIHERLEGWPTGLRLLARALHHSNSELEIEQVLEAFANSHWSVRDYFLNEVLPALPEEQRIFLLQTSILPRMTAGLCDAITNRTNSAQLLASLRESNLFLIPLDETGTWMRYLSLFASAMQQEARACLGDEQLRAISARASIRYEAHGLLIEATETALNAANFPRAASLVERLFERVWQDNALAQPEWYTLQSFLERLPGAELEHRPALCLCYAMTLLFKQMDAPGATRENKHIQSLLQMAEQQWRDANNTARLAEVFSFRALLTRQEGRVLQAVTWARQALHWLPQDALTWRNLALTTVGIGELLDGNLTHAREFAREALRLSELQGNPFSIRAAGGILSEAYLEQGELHYAAELFRQIQAEARAQEDRDDIAYMQSGLTQIEYQWNHLDAAERAAREMLEIGEQLSVEEFQALATVRLALIEYARGQSARAQQQLTIWLAHHQTPASPHDYQLVREVQATLARIQLAQGDLDAVERWFAEIEQREEILPRLQRQREQILYARLLLTRGEVVAAQELLEHLRISAIQTGHIYLGMQIQVVLILASLRQGAQANARKQLRELLAAARGSGYLRLFLDEGEELANLLRRLLPQLREKALSAYAQHILHAFASETQAHQPTPVAPLLLEPLSQQEQKVLRLLAAGNSNPSIARELVVSVNTVRTQVQSIYRKLNVHNRVEASAVARQLELL